MNNMINNANNSIKNVEKITIKNIQEKDFYLNKEIINFVSLDEKGFMVKPGITLLNKAGVYIYRCILDKNKTYIGSSINVRGRIEQHRKFINNGHKQCPKFYSSIREHGWSSFQLGVLEYIDIPMLNYNNRKDLKKIILPREQYYLDNMNPSLNLCKIAGSSLGYKKKNFSFKAELKDVRVWILDKEHNIIKILPNVNKAAQFCGTSHVALGRYLKTGKIWKDKYYFTRTDSKYK